MILPSKTQQRRLGTTKLTQCVSHRMKKRRKTADKMSSAAVGTHSSGAGPLSLMSCVRESSPLNDFEPDNEKNVSIRKRFWNPKSWFRKKSKHQCDDVTTIEVVGKKESIRSRSTSELSIAEEQTKRRSGSSMHQPGLSVSHDSVFHSPNSGSDMESDVVQSSSSLSISQPTYDIRLQTELSERLRQRRGRGDTSEDDEGLPHSPCNSPTTTDGLLDKTAIKDLPTKSHSTCSDGSLLSMGSSEMDDESFSQQSRHSSKLSLYEKNHDSDLELGPSTSSAPLNHSAAHHRVAVRPKRRAPHRTRVPQLSTALPTTPEVNEESSVRSMTPESVSKETITDVYTSSMITKTTSTTTLLTENQLKCSSLPPGLVAPTNFDMAGLNRSQSNAGSKSHDEIIDEIEEKPRTSFFERILPRKSGKKRKSKESKSANSLLADPKPSKPIAAPRTGAAARQRVQPLELPPPSPDKKDDRVKSELERRFKLRQQETVIEREMRKEEIRVKIPRLSSLQQKVMSLSQDEMDDNGGFKSLTHFIDDNKSPKPLFLTKSHSFKANKQFLIEEKLEKNSAGDESVDSKLDDESEQKIENSGDFGSITISGPSHTAIVNVSTPNEAFKEALACSPCKSLLNVSKSVESKEVSVTKIQVKRESSVSQNVAVPEFYARQLNKVEKPGSNIVFSMNLPRIIDDQSRPKTLNLNQPIEPKARKFSQEEMEIIDRSEEEVESPVGNNRFKKNERKVSTSPDDSPMSAKAQFSRSISLESLKGEMESSDRSSSNSLDNLDDDKVELGKERSGSVVETVILRRKSQLRQKDSEEPELMKVFARRSLKLKDFEDLNPEVAEEPPKEEPRRVSEGFIKLRRNSSLEKEEEKSPPAVVEQNEDVVLRKQQNNLFGFQQQRSLSVNIAKSVTHKLLENRKTDHWNPTKISIDSIEHKIDELISLAPKSELIEKVKLNETNNFNQRKAQWEKRAQEAKK